MGCASAIPAGNIVANVYLLLLLLLYNLHLRRVSLFGQTSAVSYGGLVRTENHDNVHASTAGRDVTRSSMH